MKMRVISAVCAAVACILVVTAQADAQETFWSVQPASQERMQIPVGETVTVPAAGSLRFKVTEGKRKLVKMSCEAEGVEAFTNNLVNGEGETRSISFVCNEGVVITALGSWNTLLTYPSWPLVDTWSGVKLDVRRGETDLGIFEGSLHPEIGDADSQGEIEGRIVDDPDYGLKFKLGNRLLEPLNKRELSVTGDYKLGTKSTEVITGEVPGGFVYVGEKEESAVTSAVGKLHYRLALARRSGDHDAG